MICTSKISAWCHLSVLSALYPASANENFSLEVISSESRLPSGLFSFYSSLLSGYLKENIRTVSLSKVIRWHFFS